MINTTVPNQQCVGIVDNSQLAVNGEYKITARAKGQPDITGLPFWTTNTMLADHLEGLGAIQQSGNAPSLSINQSFLVFDDSDFTNFRILVRLA